MELSYDLIQLPGHVDVPLRRLVALVTHEGLQGVARQPGSVHCGERPPQVVEAVPVAGVGVGVLLGTGDDNARGVLDRGELFVELPASIAPGEHDGPQVDQLAKVLNHDGMERNPLVSLPLVVRSPRDGMPVPYSYTRVTKYTLIEDSRSSCAVKHPAKVKTLRRRSRIFSPPNC